MARGWITRRDKTMSNVFPRFGLIASSVQAMVRIEGL